jgi:hypothetical protein
MIRYRRLTNHARSVCWLLFAVVASGQTFHLDPGPAVETRRGARLRNDYVPHAFHLGPGPIKRPRVRPVGCRPMTERL